MITEIELGTNYPENIYISSAKQENGKFKGFLYMMRDEKIHKLMISTSDSFENEKDCESYLHDYSQKCVDEYRDFKEEYEYHIQKEYDGRKNCEHCNHFVAFSPSKNRCMLIGLDLKNRKKSINLHGICNKYEKKS